MLSERSQQKIAGNLEQTIPHFNSFASCWLCFSNGGAVHGQGGCAFRATTIETDERHKNTCTWGE
jgi:hypothetical protein